MRSVIERRSLILGAAAAGLAAPALAKGKPMPLAALYGRGGAFSDAALDLKGRRITVTGFMAPPLKANMAFFVLTEIPMAVCPFCSDAAEWPDDIVAIYTKRVIDVVPYDAPVATTGVLELGERRDPDTGFVSLVRLVDSVYAR
jgi:hypothetical protein